MKNTLIIADVGAAGNLVKNLCLLSSNVHWPFNENRFNRIKKQYSPGVNFQNWLPTEYTLRFWKNYYNIDLSDNLNYDEYVEKYKAPSSLPVVFLNHSAFYQIEEFLKFQKHLDIVYVRPMTDIGFEWQVRSYCEKKSVNLLHNFTFDNEVDHQKNTYISKHGIESYYELNINNMRHILKQRQIELSAYVDSIPLELFLTDKKAAWDQFKINCAEISSTVEKNEFDSVLTTWQNLHWNFNDTYKWKYSSCP